MKKKDMRRKPAMMNERDMPMKGMHMMANGEMMKGEMPMKGMMPPVARKAAAKKKQGKR